MCSVGELFRGQSIVTWSERTLEIPSELGPGEPERSNIFSHQLASRRKARLQGPSLTHINVSLPVFPYEWITCDIQEHQNTSNICVIVYIYTHTCNTFNVNPFDMYNISSIRYTSTVREKTIGVIDYDDCRWLKSRGPSPPDGENNTKIRGNQCFFLMPLCLWPSCSRLLAS